MKTLTLICVLLLSWASEQRALAEQKLEGHIFEEEKNDLDQIVKNRYFRVLTSRNAFDYHIYQGKPRGYQYELINEFAKRLNRKFVKKGIGIQFELIPADYDQLIPMLEEGKGDMIAANLTVTRERSKKVRFTEPLRSAKELLVTRIGLEERSPFRKRIAMRKSSSYYQSIKRWNQKRPDKFLAVRLVDETLTPEAILELVSLGKFDYALIDSHIFEAAQKVYQNLTLTNEQPFKKEESSIAIAVRKNSPKLLKELNAFIPKVKKGSYLGNIIDSKYFNDTLLLKAKEQDGERISPYDELLKKYASKYGWDWKLLAALCFQESRFNQDIVNRWGAIGLFQVKQQTADEPYVGISDIRGKDKVENNIHAGVKYLSWIRERYFKELPERRRLRMTLAAYNAGPASVIRARELAGEMKLDPNIWFRNVELAMSKLRKSEPVSYVSQINKRYVSYTLPYEDLDETDR